MGVFGRLDSYKREDITEEDARIAANVITQYIQEDGIEDKEDIRVERFMRFSTEFLSIFKQVNLMLSKEGSKGVASWQVEQNSAFEKHAKDYQSLYQEIGYMARPPYHLTNWSMCAVVESALIACNLKDSDNVTIENKAIEDVLGFSQNLLQSMFEEHRAG
tara:strand:- start:1257 stop:1739 length:483 start_codon:yes stop_codon:yes gene_type:complete